MDIKEKIKRINLYRKLLHLFLVSLNLYSWFNIGNKSSKDLFLWYVLVDPSFRSWYNIYKFINYVPKENFKVDKGLKQFNTNIKFHSQSNLL